VSERLVQAIAEMEDEQALQLTREMLDQGTDPMAILDACRAGMEIVGQRFERGEYFLPELILAGEMLKEISAEVKPRRVLKKVPWLPLLEGGGK
jgi:methanogenic corrinoid protein MtbC1